MMGMMKDRPRLAYMVARYGRYYGTGDWTSVLSLQQLKYMRLTLGRRKAVCKVA